jgi:hypothetical protein
LKSSTVGAAQEVHCELLPLVHVSGDVQPGIGVHSGHVSAGPSER